MIVIDLTLNVLMLALHFEVAAIKHRRLEVIGELMNYKAYVFITF
jgi:hypothetical protein